MKTGWAPAAGLLAATFASAAPEEAPTRASLELVFETESARATLDVLTGARPATPEEVGRVALLKGNRALVRQAGRFRPAWNEASFRDGLEKAARAEPLGDDPWGFGIVRERLEATRSLLRKIETDPKAVSSPVVARLAQFLPAGAAARVEVHFLVGGSSDGFAPGDGDFYVALHYFRGDEEGLRVLMSHELFHVLRKSLASARAEEPGPAHAVKARALLAQTMDEGVASWIGDPTRAAGGGPYVAWFAQKYKRNLDRIGENTTLFDTLVFRTWNDPQLEEGKLYPLGFSGAWDSPLYFVGYAMAKFLEEKEGPQAVAAAVREGPLAFFNLYLEAAKRHPEAPVVFSASTHDILRQLQAASRRPPPI